MGRDLPSQESPCPKLTYAPPVTNAPRESVDRHLLPKLMVPLSKVYLRPCSPSDAARHDKARSEGRSQTAAVRLRCRHLGVRLNRWPSARARIAADAPVFCLAASSDGPAARHLSTRELRARQRKALGLRADVTPTQEQWYIINFSVDGIFPDTGRGSEKLWSVIGGG